MGKREELQAEARAIHQCDYDERAGGPTELEARLASEVVVLLRERDEARARIARYVGALDEVHASLNEPLPATHEAWEAQDRRTSDAHHAADVALAALRATPAGEGGR